jgi:hypothetical protein
VGNRIKASSGAMIASLTNRNTLLVDKIKKLESQLNTQTMLNHGMSERARRAIQQLSTLMRAAATNSQSFSPVSVQHFESEIHKIVAELVGQLWFQHGLTPLNDFEREIRAMFSQQHYGKMAELIKEQRVRIEKECVSKAGYGQPDDLHLVAREKEAQHRALSEFQAALIKTFEADNPKFKTFKFIEAASHHVIG